MRCLGCTSRLCLLAMSGLLLGGCSLFNERDTCARDLDCSDGEFCYTDGRCLPRELAGRVGADVGAQCSIKHGKDVGCQGSAICKSGYCAGTSTAVDAAVPAVADASFDASSAVHDAGPSCGVGTEYDLAPLFGGIANVIADGPDALQLSWYAAADETLPQDIAYRVYQAQAPHAIDFAGAPIATVSGATTYVVSGLTVNKTYTFAVRAVDELGQTDCNDEQVSAAPRARSACPDFARDVQPIFDNNCVACHTGETASRGLRLTSYAEAMKGGVSGRGIASCEPELSVLFLKVAQDNPPFGVRMPRGGPYLSDGQIETLRTWIEQGASQSCPGNASLCGGDADAGAEDAGAE